MNIKKFLKKKGFIKLNNKHKCLEILKEWNIY